MAKLGKVQYIINTSYFPTSKGPPCNYMGEAETPGIFPGASFLIRTNVNSVEWSIFQETFVE
jgi:hypothetical protein